MEDETITEKILKDYGCTISFFNGTLLVTCPTATIYFDIAFRVACRPQDILAIASAARVNNVLTVTDGKRDQIQLRL